MEKSKVGPLPRSIQGRAPTGGEREFRGRVSFSEVGGGGRLKKGGGGGATERNVFRQKPRRGLTSYSSQVQTTEGGDCSIGGCCSSSSVTKTRDASIPKRGGLKKSPSVHSRRGRQ